MHRFILGCVLALWAVPAPAGQVVDVPFAMEVGDRAEIVSERTKENPAHAAKGWPAERTRSVDLMEVVEELPEGGYLLRVTSREYGVEGGDPAARAAKRAFMASLMGIAADFEVSETGAPRLLRDWRPLTERVLENLDGAVTQAGVEPAVAGKVAGMVRGMFAGLDDARATQVFGEGLAMWAAMHDLRLEEGRTVGGTATEVSPLTGDPVDMVYSLRLANLDRAGGLARVEVRQTASPESVARMVDGLVERTAQSLGQKLPEEGRAEIRRLFESPDNEFAFNQTFEVGLDDGWTRTVVDERTTRLGTAAQGRQLTRLTVRRLP